MHCIQTVRDVQMVTIKGIRCNCEAAKRQIEAIVDSSMKRKPHSQSEVCVWDVLICCC